MGYNITIYCRCCEEGLTSEPPIPRRYITRNSNEGYLCRVGLPPSTLEDDLKFDSWEYDACDHEGGQFHEGHIGNAASVGHFRQSLKQCSGPIFPNLWNMFIVNSRGNYPPEILHTVMKELQEFRQSSEFDEYCEYTAKNLGVALNIAIYNKLPIHIT